MGEIKGSVTMDKERRMQEMKRRREQERRKGMKKSAKKKRSRKALWLVMLALVLIGALVVGAYTVFFPVKTIAVNGNTQYTDEQIIKAGGIEMGDSLLALNPNDIEYAVRAACPYVHSVTVERKLPTKLILTVKEGPPVLSFYQNNQYFLVNNQYELMEQNEKPMGGMVVHGFTLTSNGVSKTVTLAPAEKTELLKTLVDQIGMQGITEITQIDLRDVNNIRLLFEDRHVWELGNAEKLDYKLKFGAEISGKEEDQGVVKLGGLNNGKDAYFAPGTVGEFVPEKP